MAEPHGLEVWGRPVDPSGVMQAWAQDTAERNAQSLRDGQGPGGAPFAPLTPSTVKRKKGDARPGYGRTRAMADGLTAPGTIRRRSKTRYQVLGAPPGTAAEDEVTFFVTGRKTIRAATLRQAKAIAKEAGVRTSKLVGTAKKVTAARDFFGHDEAIVEAAADRLADDVLRQMGFA